MSKPNLLPFATTADIRDHCLCLHVQRAARTIARHYDEALRPAQLTHGQFSLLMALNRPEPPNLGAVAALLGMDRTTLTANAKPLARRGLLKAMIDAADRRSRRLCLTAKGRAALSAAVPLWKAAQAEIERRLKKTSPDRLRAALRALA
jgi:DNA-binding MarR family transcriptional regulator